MLKIQYLSDLHLEFPENKAFVEANPIEAIGDILIMAGDILPFVEIDKFKSFFDRISQQFETVYWLPGNHEYYGSDIKKRTGEFSENIRENVILLNNKIIEIKSFTFLFSTLWTELPKEKSADLSKQWPDFNWIKNNEYNFSPQDYNKLYKENVAFLENTLVEKEGNSKTVIVTHHPPTFQVLSEKYAVSAFREAFASDLVNLIRKESPGCWIYGHNHHNIGSFNIGKSTLITNQLGYVKHGEHDQFSTAKKLELK